MLNWIKQLEDIETQVNQGYQVIKIGENTYKKAESLVTYHGDWKDLTPFEAVRKVNRTADQKLYTTTSILNTITDAPETVVNKSDILRKYIGKIDTVNWTVEDKKSKDKILPNMVALKQYDVYEEYRKKNHGYKDEDGYVHKGELDGLNDELEAAKKELGAANNDVQVRKATTQVMSIESQIDYLLRKEEFLRERYETAKKVAEDAKIVKSQVADARVAKEVELERNDKEVRIPPQSAITKYFKDQEAEVL